MVNKIEPQHKIWQVSNTTGAIVLALATFLVWTLAMYLLEGRINLLQEPTIAGRFVYVLVANVLIGTLGAIWVLRSLIDFQFVTVEQAGFR